MTSMTATHVFGLDGVLDVATSPITNAAMTPITIVMPNAPR